MSRVCEVKAALGWGADPDGTGRPLDAGVGPGAASAVPGNCSYHGGGCSYHGGGSKGENPGENGPGVAVAGAGPKVTPAMGDGGGSDRWVSLLLRCEGGEGAAERMWRGSAERG